MPSRPIHRRRNTELKIRVCQNEVGAGTMGSSTKLEQRCARGFRPRRPAIARQRSYYAGRPLAIHSSVLLMASL
jgi:hypothetical protein